jgi:hypothetical protein
MLLNVALSHVPATFSRAGTAHNLTAVPVFLGLPAAAARALQRTLPGTTAGTS